MPRPASIDKFTPQERKFIESYAMGMTQTQAATAAGYASPASRGRDLLLRPEVMARIRELQEENERAAGYTRAEFVEGMRGAIEMAKRLSDPVAMIAGHRELGKACGYYAEEKKKVEVTVNGQVLHRLEQLPDAELIKLLEQQGETIDVTPTAITEDN